MGATRVTVQRAEQARRDRLMQSVPLRVLMLAPRLFETPHLGGGERYVSELSRVLQERHDIALTLVTVSTPPGIELRFPEQGRHRIAIRELVAVCHRADIIHVHQINAPVFDLAAVLARVTATPLVLTDLGGGWLTLGRVLGHHRLRLVSGLASISDTSTKDLHWSSAKPARILYGGGEHVLRGALSKRFRATDFVYVGRLLPHKGVDLLIDALPQGRSLRVCGSVADPSFLRRIQSLAVDKDVEFVMSPSDEELAAIYTASSFTVLPSQQRLGTELVRRPELLGLVLLESLACGTPCLGSNIPAIREILEPIGMPTFEAGSVHGLRSILMRLPGQDSPEHQRYRELCASAAEHYSWNKSAKRAVDFYNELLWT